MFVPILFDFLQFYIAYTTLNKLLAVFARDSYAVSAHMLSQFHLSVRPSVCHTGGSVKNG